MVIGMPASRYQILATKQLSIDKAMIIIINIYKAPSTGITRMTTIAERRRDEYL